MPAAPQPTEVETYTVRVHSTITLAGMTPAQFTAARQLSVRKVFAANAGVHFNYVTISDVRQGGTVAARHRRLGTMASVSFTLALRASPATAGAVETSVTLMAAQESALAAQLNEQLERDGNTGAGLSLTVVAIATPAGVAAPPPLYVVVETRLVSGPADDPSQPSLSRAGSPSSGTSTLVLTLAARQATCAATSAAVPKFGRENRQKWPCARMMACKTPPRPPSGATSSCSSATAGATPHCLPAG